MSKSNNGKISVEGLQLDTFCDICQRDRAHGNHRACSKARQERYRLAREAKAAGVKP